MTLRQRISDRSSTILRDWETFRREKFPVVVADVIERDQSGLPADFVPWAPGIVVASDYLLRAAGYRPGSSHPEGWYPSVERGVITKSMHRNRLKVRPCGKFWRIERAECEVLAFPFGSLPVVTRTKEAAMYLADYCHPAPRKGENCHPRPRGVASNLCWVMFDAYGFFSD